MAEAPKLFEDEVLNLDDDPEEVIPFKYSITSYGADYPIDGLVKRMQNDAIYVPEFQRGYVWSAPQGSRFVESLLLGLPVPGIFLSKEPETERLLVIDGQQRLRTLSYFYEGALRLQRVHSQFEGRTYSDLEDEDRRRLDDSIIHATVVKQDEPSQDNSSIYHVFERLNTGGTLLTAQEIRACIYHGEFNELLHELNEAPAWRDIYGEVSARMRDQELILRFLALYFGLGRYEKPMKAFLNSFMARNRHLERHEAAELREAFLSTVEVAASSLGPSAFRPRRALNAAVFDAVMIGLRRRLDTGDHPDPDEVSAGYEQLLQNEEFEEATARQTSDEAKVALRVELATEAFA